MLLAVSKILAAPTLYLIPKMFTGIQASMVRPMLWNDRCGWILVRERVCVCQCVFFEGFSADALGLYFRLVIYKSKLMVLWRAFDPAVQ